MAPARGSASYDDMKNDILLGTGYIKYIHTYLCSFKLLVS